MALDKGSQRQEHPHSLRTSPQGFPAEPNPEATLGLRLRLAHTHTQKQSLLYLAGTNPKQLPRTEASASAATDQLKTSLKYSLVHNFGS